MTKQIIGGPSDEGLSYSKCIKAGDFIYVSGIVGFAEDGLIVSGGIVAETRQVLSELRDILNQAGCSFADVIKINVCLPDPDDFESFEKEYSRWFEVDPPVRVTICAKLTIDAKVEIDAIAYTGT